MLVTNPQGLAQRLGVGLASSESRAIRSDPATMLRPIPIGISDFRNLREQGMEYVDKSLLIRDILDNGAQVSLLPRPRRFGKTLNLSMLRYFFEKSSEDLRSLFADLAIAQAGTGYQEHFQRYPVIFITFKGVKAECFDDAWTAIRELIQKVFDAHRELLHSGHLSELEASHFRAILDGSATRSLYEGSFLELSGALSRQSGEKVVILIDEYDQPNHSGWSCGYSAEILGFFRNFLKAALKDNPFVFKAVLTGILRVAKESISSGLNNLEVYSLLRAEFSTAFGFTESEVESLLSRAGRLTELEAVRGYYNGYSFGGTSIYNPWSILSYLNDREKRLRPYWVNTSSNDLVREALVRRAPDIQKTMEALLAGETIESSLDENVVLSDLSKGSDSVLSLLTFSGYLRAEETPGTSAEIRPYLLSIPNREIRQVFASTFRDWMKDRLGGASSVDRLRSALLSGDAESLEEELQIFTESVLSFHDVALRPEQVYHAFVIGLLASLEPDYEVRSNRESGRGRPDVSIRPKLPGKPGALLELKVARPGRKTPEQALAEAVKQIQEQNYAAELRAAGATPIFAFAVAFDGKQVWCRCP